MYRNKNPYPIPPLLKCFTMGGEEYMEVDTEAVMNVEKGRYYVSESGKVYDTKFNKFVPQHKDNKGYMICGLSSFNSEGGRYSTTCRVHRLVMIAFKYTRNCHELQVNHMDAVKTNNNLDNLEWCTNAENMDHARRMGLINANHVIVGLTEEKVHQICKRLEDESYVTVGALAQEYGVAVTTISDIAKGIAWKEISSQYDIDYNWRHRLSDDQVHFICQVFENNNNYRSFQWMYDIILYYLGLPENRYIRRRIYKIYKKDPYNYAHITSQYNW